MDSLWVDWQKIKEPLAIVIPGADDYVVGRIKFSHLFAPVKRNDNIMKIIVSASNTIQRTGRIIAIIIIKKLN